ncbi:hypothetical protein A1O1_06480 [Capronia coronata CBS 617.96]|uniref:Cytochrome P450 oxidoreductase n=1 Tax=Capronia coronata CBS 617.96 TaxID=1182541 RepID=W9YA27_9EURO|nr:uncharacterized protein A1O1_06480 [Capronia coronata CBS 617.96]EXJ86111.1 hypothetical protein A1O1_06480 [Capronia coronata CBS 617.96]
MAGLTHQLSLKELCAVVICAWLLFRVFLVTKRVVLTPLRHVPGPWYAPWTNLWLKYQVMTGNRSQYIHSLHQAYGPFVRISPDEIAVADLPSIKHVYRVGSDFRKADWYQKFNESAHPGLFSMIDAKQHAARRRLFAQSFSNSSIVKFEAQIRQKVDTAISKIRRDASATHADGKGRADLLRWLTFMATDVIGELSFGTSFNMLEQEKKTPYIRDLETTMMIAGIRAELGFLGPLLRVAKHIPVGPVQNALTLNDRMDEYGLAAIENHKRHVMAASQSNDNGQMSPSNSNSNSSLFSKFLDPTRNQELSLPQISAEASNLIVAGSDTTAVSLTYLIWSVLRPRHRNVKQKLLAEIESLPIDASLAEISQLKYLQAVINESLRLYGAAPGSLPRVSPPGGAKLGGRYNIPEGTIVGAQAFTVHRDGAIFPDPDSFIPERWEQPTEAMKDAFFPFGLGSRVCLGIHLASNELLLGAFVFFKTCPTAVLAESTTDSSMEMENYFLIAPRAHRCEVTTKG